MEGTKCKLAEALGVESTEQAREICKGCPNAELCELDELTANCLKKYLSASTVRKALKSVKEEWTALLRDELRRLKDNPYHLSLDVELKAMVIRLYGCIAPHIRDTILSTLREYEATRLTEFQRLGHDAVTYLRQMGCDDVVDVIKKHEAESLADKKKRLKDAIFLSLARWNEWTLIEELSKAHIL